MGRGTEIAEKAKEIHSLNETGEDVILVIVILESFELLYKRVVNHLQDVLLPFNNDFNLIFLLLSFLFLNSFHC